MVREPRLAAAKGTRAGAAGFSGAKSVNKRRHAMARFDRLIAFLEHEADVLRSRLETLQQQATPTGLPTGEVGLEAANTQVEATEVRLAEIESHIADLRAENAAG